MESAEVKTAIKRRKGTKGVQNIQKPRVSNSEGLLPFAGFVLKREYLSLH